MGIFDFLRPKQRVEARQPAHSASLIRLNLFLDRMKSRSCAAAMADADRKEFRNLAVCDPALAWASIQELMYHDEYAFRALGWALYDVPSWDGFRSEDLLATARKLARDWRHCQQPEMLQRLVGMCDRPTLGIINAALKEDGVAAGAVIALTQFINISLQRKSHDEKQVAREIFRVSHNGSLDECSIDPRDLVRHLLSEHALVRECAVSLLTLAEWKPTSENVALAFALASNDIKSLVAMGPKAVRVAVNVLVRCKWDDRSSLICEIARSINSAEFLPVVRAWASSTDESLKIGGLMALSRIGVREDLPILVKAIEATTTHSNWRMDSTQQGCTQRLYELGWIPDSAAKRTKWAMKCPPCLNAAIFWEAVAESGDDAIPHVLEFAKERIANWEDADDLLAIIAQAESASALSALYECFSSISTRLTDFYIVRVRRDSGYGISEYECGCSITMRNLEKCAHLMAMHIKSHWSASRDTLERIKQLRNPQVKKQVAVNVTNTPTQMDGGIYPFWSCDVRVEEVEAFDGKELRALADKHLRTP